MNESNYFLQTEAFLAECTAVKVLDGYEGK